MCNLAELHMEKDLVCVYFCLLSMWVYLQLISVGPRCWCESWHRIHTCQISDVNTLSDKVLGIGSTVVSHQQTLLKKQAHFLKK